MYQILQRERQVILKDGESLLRLSSINQRTVRITATKRDHFLPEKDTENFTPVVLNKEPDPDYTLLEEKGFLTLKLTHCRLRINLETGAITYLDPSGSVLVREPERGGRHLLETQVFRNVFSEEGKLTQKESADGVKVTGGTYETVPDRMAYRAKVEFVFGKEALYGFGSHEEGYGNLRGKSRQLYQQNMKACVPSFVSTNGYGFLLTAVPV